MEMILKRFSVDLVAASIAFEKETKDRELRLKQLEAGRSRAYKKFKSKSKVENEK